MHLLGNHKANQDPRNVMFSPCGPTLHRCVRAPNFHVVNSVSDLSRNDGLSNSIITITIFLYKTQTRSSLSKYFARQALGRVNWHHWFIRLNAFCKTTPCGINHSMPSPAYRQSYGIISSAERLLRAARLAAETSHMRSAGLGRRPHVLGHP